MITWTLIVYFQVSGAVMPVATLPDKPTCDHIAASFNAGHDTGIQVFTCVPAPKPAVYVPSKAETEIRDLHHQERAAALEAMCERDVAGCILALTP